MTVPPGTAPAPRTVNGIAPRPPSSMTAPISRSAAMIAATGRREAAGSPRNSTATLVSVATGGTNRITVPALPTSTRVSWLAQPGVTRQAAGSLVSTWTPRACSAPAISSVSLARSG